MDAALTGLTACYIAATTCIPFFRTFSNSQMVRFEDVRPVGMKDWLSIWLG